MKQLLSASLVKKSLVSHSWLGLCVGALMYLVCLSGTLAVFHHEWERWEQPKIEEGVTLAPESLQQAYAEAAQRIGETHDIVIGLPVGDSPRTTISADGQGWFVNADGSLGESVNHGWAELMTDLHLYLHLPHNWGIIVVSILGAMLCGLIISGFLAHPGIFRDAFSLRGNGARMEQVDIHNRLSVWGTPFHLMIAITGAFFGLAQFMGLLVAMAFYDGNTEAMLEELYGGHPHVEQSASVAQVSKALAQMPEIAPEAKPFYITVEHPGEDDQFILVGAEHPGRLIYAEQYRFSSDGERIDHVGFSDGPVGQQFIFSVYRLHFGNFGGLATKILFLIGGLALTVVSVTGINIWLHKRKHRDAINNLWAGLVWGTPLALAVMAVVDLYVGAASVGLYWLLTVVAMAVAQWLDDEARTRFGLQCLTSAALVVLVFCHSLQFGWQTNAAANGLNLSFIATALILLWWARFSWARDQGVRQSLTAAQAGKA